MKAGGWGGSAEGMVEGSQPQPWHCLPFVEASTYGLELVYQHETECHVVNDGGAVRIDWDPTKEPGRKLTGGEFLFFSSAGAPEYYLFNPRLDLQAPPGHVLRTEPHPRFFTDPTRTAPMALIGHVQSEWYPRKLFVVFRVPPPGGRHVFRKGEPYAQVIFVSQRVKYQVEPFTPEQDAARRDLERSIESVRTDLAENVWHNPKGVEFNNHYKVMARAFADEGAAGVRRVVDDALARQQGAIQKDKSVAEIMAVAASHVARDEFNKARPIYEHVLRVEPRNAAALRQLGICVGCTGAPLNGLKLMAAAISLEPNLAAHHATMGKMLTLLQRNAEAEAAYRTALRLKPGDAEYLSALGLLVAQRGALAEGLNLCRAATEAAPDDPAPHYYMAVIFTRQGQVAEARACNDAALAARPGYEPSMRALNDLPAQKAG